MLLNIHRCAIFTSLLILHAPLILAASGKQVELPTCSGELPPNENGNWPPPNRPLFRFQKGVLITAGHDDYANLQSLCVDDPESNLPSMGCICTIDHRTLCKERFRWDALADYCEHVCECPNESEEDKQKGFMSKLLGTKSLGRVSIDVSGSSRKKSMADESERSSSFHGYGSRGDGVPRQRSAVNTPYDNNVCGRGCRDAEECTRFEGAWGCQSLVCMLQGVTSSSFRKTWANGVCVSALTASLGLGKGGSNFGLRRRGTLEMPACACNTTYVSTGCCAVTDGLVWEAPEMYLGEVVLA